MDAEISVPDVYAQWGNLNTPQTCKHLALLPDRKLREALASSIRVSTCAWD